MSVRRLSAAALLVALLAVLTPTVAQAAPTAEAVALATYDEDTHW